MRVAIVGLGPKGLFALQALVERWGARGDGEPLEVHTFDARPPGTGAAYHPDQPDFLRLNVSPSILRLDPLPPFVEWLPQPVGRDVPRAAVGRYLAEAHRALLAELPEGVAVHHHAERVERLEPAHPGWRVGDLLVDEVLLATGHADDHDDRLAHHWETDQPTRLVPCVYPVEQWLDEQHVPAGSTVAVRGAALTFIDTVLALTEGRPRDRWPARILPVGRGGQLMLTKPERWQPSTAQQEALQAAGQELSRGASGDVRGVLDVVRRAAGQLLVLDGWLPERARAGVERTLATGWDPWLTGPPRALAALEHSIAVDEGLGRPGPAWMLGRAWAALYPQVVEVVSFSDPDPQAWREFSRAAAVLEKFTYGPLRANAERLVALCHDGVLDLSWLEGGVRIGSRVEGLLEGEGQPDVVVDAVNAPPGVLAARNPLLDRLVADGHLQPCAPRRGVAITRAANCLPGPDSPWQGEVVPGLSALGRPVEDVVVGNDTLGRSLHDQVERWAQRLATPAR